MMKYKIDDIFHNGNDYVLIKRISGLIIEAKIFKNGKSNYKHFDEVTLEEYLKENGFTILEEVKEVSISIRTIEKWYKMLCIDGINSKKKVAEELENILKEKGEL